MNIDWHPIQTAPIGRLVLTRVLIDGVPPVAAILRDGTWRDEHGKPMPAYSFGPSEWQELTRVAYIVWNEARSEGYLTFDKGVAYEARKGAESNCFDRDGTQMHLAQAFCGVTPDDNCTIQEIEIPS